ncbi:MAG TPA: CotH kinase family protein, partial [Polyangiaceae bacterium]
VYDALAGIELRGRSSIEYAKKNYAVELRFPNAVENPQNLFGMGQESDWIFDGSWVDRSFMRNDLVFELFRDLGHYGAESHYCNLTLNGEERGIYRLVERVKRDDDRVDLSLDDGTGQSFLIKQDDTGLLRFDVGAEDRWQIVYPRQDDATAAQVDAIQQWLDGLNDALQAPQAAGVFTFLDPASTTDYVLVQEFAKNIDAYNLSLHLARNMGGLAKFVPWDTDLAFGQPTLRNQMNEATSGWVNTRTLLIRSLAQNPDLKARLGPRWRELRAGPLAEAAVFAKLDRYAAALLPAAVERNFRIWPIADVDFSEIYPPYTLYGVTSHAEELTRLRSWISARLTWVDDHIDAYPSAM